jgi:dethiobiotin synthetase
MTRLGPGLFVTGTDTGVGKTVVSTGLLRLALRAGVRLVPFKPVETGVGPAGPSDARALLAASQHQDLALADVCPVTFPEPVAPAAAAHHHARPISIPRLLSAAGRLRRRGDALLVESAGGLLSPYTARATAADLAARMALPILLIARNGLGTINHTALCLAELRRRRLPVAAVLLVATTPAPPHDERNAELISATTGVRPYLLPFLADPTPDAVADVLGSIRAVTRLVRTLRPSAARASRHRVPRLPPVRGRSAPRASSGR